MAIRFRTELTPDKRHRGEIDHSSGLLLLGSCFSDEIGSRLVRAGFDATVNPSGTLYNPMSIAAALDRFSGAVGVPEECIIEHGGLWHSMDHHTRFSAADRDVLMRNMSRSQTDGAMALSRATHIIVTFGTAYVYELNDTGRVVANCHKLPADRFVRRMLTVDEIAGRWIPLMETLAAMNPSLKIIFTVSPIRHVADGLHGNQLSKATLHIAVERLVNASPGRVEYFPAYEALIDDLRDYRFYADDLVHPSTVGVDYVYSLFSDTYFDESTKAKASACEREFRRSAHRPISPA